MGYIFRAYHQPQTQRFYTRQGMPTGAIFVFNTMLRKLLTAHKPDYVAAVFDVAGPTFRDEMFAAYKANRAEMPSELARQLPYIRRLLEALRIPILEYQGFEADDVIGALANQGAGQGMEVTIVSSDKDMLQLVRNAAESTHGSICVLIPTKDDLVCDEAKVEEVVGVGPRLVPDVMALRGDAIDNIPGAPGIGEKGSKDLIQRFGSVEAALDHAAEVERKTYRESLQNYREQILQSKKLATIVTDIPVSLDLDAITAGPPDGPALMQLYTELEFHSLAQEFLPKLEQGARQYRDIANEAEARELFARLEPGAAVVLGLDNTAEQMNFSPGLAVSAEAGEAWFVPARLLEAARDWLESDRAKVLEDGKQAIRVLRRHRIRLAGVEHDALLYSYLLDPTISDHRLESAVERRFSSRLSGNLSERADVLGQLARALAPDIRACALDRVYREIELPLEPVLADMEQTGIRVDVDELARLSTEIGRQAESLAGEIYRLCGSEFNINSPQQLSKILFEGLKLRAPTKYGKGKVYSTAVEVLEGLAEEHEVPRRVLEYRQLTKLKGTYMDALPRLIDAHGRIHTTFDQAGTATGRLSSRDPNLQNIPIRSELGRQIRAAFVPEPGWTLIAADYSQIELRLLAHFSADKVLVEAFRRGEDIHCRTAELVFGVPPLMQTREHRRRAKAINYGIVYGLSPFGLSAQLGIDRAEAKQFIDNYFATYTGVKRYIDQSLEQVRKAGFVATLYGRRRPIPEINSKNPQQRGFAERTAINTPLQGTAADLVKLAMIRIQREFTDAGMQTRMLLQVHDELVFETPAAELDQARQRIKRAMETVEKLAVPLLADVGAGPNWRDAK